MPRLRQVLRLGFKTQKFEISRDTVDQFEQLSNRRDIRKGTVKQIFDNLMGEKHFDAPFVVHKKDGKFQLIDGNHRYEAIKNYLDVDLNKNHRIEIILNIYENLTEKQLKELFTQWNLGKKQSTNDVVKQYKDDIKIFKYLEKDFPCYVTIYGGSNAISFYKLVGSYLASIQPKFQGSFIGNAWEFVEEVKQLDRSDVNNMKVFIEEFIKTFGPIRNNKFLRTTPFTAIMRIWMDNKGNFFPYQKMQSYFKARILNDFRADQLGSISGMKACKYAYDEYIKMLNDGRTSNIFVKREEISPEELQDEEELEN